MNKQEAIEKLQSEAVNHYSETSGWFKEIKLDIVTDIVNQLDEPVKPVIPQYVAEWLEVCKENLALSLANSMDITVMRVHHQHDKTIFWLKSAKNQETFAKAWFYGYEVEKEKLYTVGLPNPNGDSNMYGLCKVDGRIIIGAFVFGLNKASNAKLTEAEIKEDFAWAWQFAEEVEE
ncbi:DUF1642 domain-containing protein [Streptococcus gallolyticus]|uniref:DUF1642 domain-containing protein n=1 Tax=Streptococcus gallolyticus TaxID=315405 RepID=UPI002284D43E|nr:DUF1642 domain-containing protein [Streptococcus gallolyticus]MCY7186390.1 DUF1642 domain-containing protein [Streptococcus gallolyticus subsp. gallolyticus]MCY7190551.1 DUF1642 domain-containing protein [Streptococcus gallolyticus subsp. gallolyticus]